MTEKGNIIPSTESDKVQIVGQNEQAFREVTHNIKPERGHIVFEVNMETGDAKPAEYEKTDLHIHDMGQQVNMHLQFRQTGKAINKEEIKKKLIKKPGCVYISALNIKNAAKQFIKRSALKWWEKLSKEEKEHLSKLFFNKSYIEEKEIIKLWHMENAANAKNG